MKIFRLLQLVPLAALLGGAGAEEPSSSTAPSAGAPSIAPPSTASSSTAPFPGAEARVTSRVVEGPAWLGFQVVRPDESTRAHLPELPAGMGFVIRSVDPKGPAEECGLTPLDVVWKFADQYLVNEGQLAVLLRQKKPGDVVSLAVFRGGKSMNIPLTIAAFPLNRPLPIGPSVENLVMAEDSGMPTRIINFENRTATLNIDDGRASLKRLGDGKGYELEIRDHAGELIFNGNLGPEGDTSGVPDAWKMRVRALRRGLDSAVDGRMEHVRPPRPRVMPTPQPPNPGD